MGLFGNDKKRFLKAAEEGDRAAVGNGNREWLTYTDDLGDNVLHKAARGGHPDIINMLMTHNLDIDRRNKAGETPLILAVIAGHKDAVQAILRHQADIHLSDRKNNTALYYAVFNGSLACVQLLLPSKPDLDTEKLLLLAIEQKHSEVALALIKAGAKVDIYDDEHNSALQIAAENGMKDIVHALLDADANPNAGDSSPLLAAIENSDAEIALALIKAGADVNVCDEEDNYAIHFAIEEGMVEVVLAIIDAGADLSVQDDLTNTPLHTAVLEEQEEILKILIAAGAPLDLEDGDGATPRQFAETENLPRFVRLLKQAEAAPKAPASKKQHEEVPAPTPAPLPMADKDTEQWVLLGKDKIAQVSTSPALGRQVTEIFNFTSMDRRIITTNLSLRTEAVSPTESMDTLSDDTLTAIYERFKKLGGKADEQTVFKNRMMKKRLGGGGISP